ncbi:unnamed protein product [Rangifer tarandus platyrhynchus]|uniref:Uncharacterized protein n=1 Tax=Rangifer tarandus platyrhynchus TaxID=3082113 RepID=A0AC59Y7G7_RANTA
MPEAIWTPQATSRMRLDGTPRNQLAPRDRTDGIPDMNMQNVDGEAFPGNVPHAKEHCNSAIAPLQPQGHPSPRPPSCRRDPGLMPAAGGRRGRAEARRGRRRVQRGDSPARRREGGLLTHRGPRGAAARPPPPAAICGGGRRGSGLPGVGRPHGDFASSPRSLPRAPSGRGTVTVCLFPRPPRETPPGQSFRPPPDEFGALALGTAPGTSSRLGGISKQQWKEGERRGRREAGKERGAKKEGLRASMPAEAQTSPSVTLGLKPETGMGVRGLGLAAPHTPGASSSKLMFLE